MARLSVVLVLGAVVCGGCQSPPRPAANLPHGFYIRIRDQAFTPLSLRVPPGATVTVIDEDTANHSVTSQTEPGAFKPGAVGGVAFDTGPFHGQTSFTVPKDTPEGTVVPYFCSVHGNSMRTPMGTITVTRRARPGPPAAEAHGEPAAGPATPWQPDGGAGVGPDGGGDGSGEGEDGGEGGGGGGAATAIARRPS